MRKLLPVFIIGVFVSFIAFIFFNSAQAIPAYTREFEVPCSTCHVHPPKLSATGLLVRLRGPTAAGFELRKGRVLFSPFAAFDAKTLEEEPDTIKGTPSEVELMFAGEFNPRLFYLAEWSVIERELEDGEIHDESGSFGHFYVRYNPNKNFQLTIGQDTVAKQLEPEHLFSISESILFSSSLEGPPTDDEDLEELRAFAVGEMSPLVRATVYKLDDESTVDGFFATLTIPFTGRFSIPLTEDAKDHAKAEFENQPKGYYLEAYRQNGVSSFGISAFSGTNNRLLFGANVYWEMGNFYAMAGLASAKQEEEWQTLGSAELTFVPSWETALGIRVDGKTGQTAVISPYLSYRLPGFVNNTRLVLEANFSESAKPKFLFKFVLMY